jgi:hypothetical protein
MDATMKIKNPMYIEMIDPLWNPPIKQLSKNTLAN